MSARLLLVAVGLAVVVVLGACRGDEEASPDVEQAEPAWDPASGLEPQEGRASDEIVSSGRMLDGVFELVGEDDGLSAVRYVFTREGEFARTLSRPRGFGEESGTYVVDARGRLVLYVERKGGELLFSAERELAGLEELAEGLALEREGREAVQYRRIGPVPEQGVRVAQ